MVMFYKIILQYQLPRKMVAWKPLLRNVVRHRPVREKN